MTPFDYGDDISQDVEDAIERLPEYNSGTFDAGSNPHGFAGGGHISQFPAALDDVATVAGGFADLADILSAYADAAAASAVSSGNNVANLSGTSTTSQALGTGSKTWTTQSGKTWPVGTTLLLTSDANPTTHWAAIVVTSYSSTTLQGDVKLFSGSGSRSDWTIRVVGYPGRAAGISYLWSTGVTASDPTSGFVKVNNATLASATAMYISETDFDGNSLGTFLATLDDGTSSVKCRAFFQSVTQPANFFIADFTGTLTDNGTWDTFSITPVASGGTLINGMQLQTLFVPTGNAGSTGPTGPSYAATSTSSNSIGTGAKTFTTQSGLAYQAGARVRITDSSNTSNWMEGLVTSYSSTTLIISADLTNGSGTLSSWLINIAGERGATGPTGAGGDDAGFKFQFNTATTSDPGSGKFLFNNATFASATSVSINETDSNSNAIAALLAAIDDGAGTNKVLVFAIKQGGSAFFSFHITSTLTDNGAYDTFTISPITTSGSIALNDTFHLIFIPLEKGAAGSTGSAGPTTAPTWIFDSGTSDADPGTNKFALNNGTIGSVTKAFINDTGLGSADMTAFVTAWDDSTNSTHRGDLFIVQASDPTKWAIFTTGTVADDGSYLDVGLTYVAGSGGFVVGEACAFAFTRAGNAGAGAGDVVGPASATDTAVALFDGGTGKLLKNSTVTLSSTVLAPATDDGIALGSTSKEWSDLFLASGAVINYANGNAVITHTSGILTVGTGDLRVTSAGANSTSVVTVGATQTLTAKTLTSPAITTPTGIVKGDVGLGNVDNTSDANKPISTAQLGHNSIVGAFRVRAATTANITISTALNNGDSLDGVTLVTGDLVLVKDQSSPSGNGIYVVAVSPGRHTLLAAFNDYPGIMVVVTEGTVNADSVWECTSDAGGTIDSSSMVFARFGGTFPSSTTDNTIPRFDGTSAKIQTSGISIDDSNNITGAAGIAASGLVSTPASATGGAGLRIPPGAAPTSPVDGDVWTTTSAYLVRINSVTLTVATLAGTQTFTGDKTFSGALVLPATVSYASNGSIVKSGNHALTFTTTNTTNVTFPAGTVTLPTTDASTLTSGSLADARLSSAATPYGTQDIWIPATAMIPNTTNGPASGTVEVGTSLVMFQTLDFDASTQESAQFSWRMPPQWNEGTVLALFVWKHAATTTNFGVVWDLAGVALSDDDAASTAFGTAVTVTDTGGTTNDVYITSATSAITIAGTPAAGDLCYFRARRVAANGSDTLAIDAGLIGVVLRITTDAGHD